MNDDDSRDWCFQLNIAGLTLLLFASSYIGQHLAMLLPAKGLPQTLLHYSGEFVLTIVAFIYAMSRAYGASKPQQERVDWLKRSTVWLYVGLGAVTVNLVLLTILLVQWKL